MVETAKKSGGLHGVGASVVNAYYYHHLVWEIVDNTADNLSKSFTLGTLAAYKVFLRYFQ